MFKQYCKLHVFHIKQKLRIYIYIYNLFPELVFVDIQLPTECAIVCEDAISNSVVCVVCAVEATSVLTIKCFILLYCFHFLKDLKHCPLRQQ